MRELYRSLFRRPFRQPAARRPTLGLTPLEGREVPAAYLVSISGMSVGETSGSNTGELVASSVPVTADSWEGAVAAAVSGSATTGDGQVRSFPGPGFLVGTVADIISQTNDADLGDFLDPADRVIGFEDWTDGDFDDAYWAVTATEVPVISIAKGSDAGEVGTDSGQVQQGSFSLTRKGEVTQATNVFFTLSGDASEGADYHVIGAMPTGSPGEYVVTFLAESTVPATITVVPKKDNVVEDGGELVTIVIGDGKTGYAADVDKSSAGMTIADDPPVVGVDLSASVGASEPGSAGGNLGVGKFVLFRTGGDLSTAMTASVTFDSGTGYATEGVDYTAEHTISFPAGSGSAPLKIVPVNDNLVEGQETVRMEVSSSNAYKLDPDLYENPSTIPLADFVKKERGLWTWRLDEQGKVLAKAGTGDKLKTLIDQGYDSGKVLQVAAAAGVADINAALPANFELDVTSFMPSLAQQVLARQQQMSFEVVRPFVESRIGAPQNIPQGKTVGDCGIDFLRRGKSDDDGEVVAERYSGQPFGTQQCYGFVGMWLGEPVPQGGVPHNFGMHGLVGEGVLGATDTEAKTYSPYEGMTASNPDLATARTVIPQGGLIKRLIGGAVATATPEFGAVAMFNKEGYAHAAIVLGSNDSGDVFIVQKTNAFEAYGVLKATDSRVGVFGTPEYYKR